MRALLKCVICCLSLTAGVRVSITARRPCWIGVYWGTAIADMYPVIHRPWLQISDIATTSALMSSISMDHEDLHMCPFCLFQCRLYLVM